MWITGKSFPINWKKLKFIREGGGRPGGDKASDDEKWGIKTELLHVFKRNNRVSSIYVDDGPSVDISLPLCKILDKNSISWLDLFAFEVCSRFESQFVDFFRLQWSDECYEINTPRHYDINCDNKEIESYDVDMRYGFDIGATDKDICVLGRNRCRCDARCFNRLHVEHMFAMQKSAKHPEWVAIPPRHEYYQNWMLSKCCFISPKYLIAVGIARNKNFSDNASIATTVVELFDFNEFFSSSTENHEKSSLQPKWKVLKSNLPNDILGAALVTTHSDDMYLIGGFVYEHGTIRNSGRIEDILQDIGKVSNKVFKGKFLKSQKDISWTEVESLIQARGGHVSFKMGNNIYVAGGFVEKFRNHQDGQFKKSKVKEAVIQTSNWTSSCERYDLNEEKWSACSYVFPHIDITLGSYGVSSDLLNATVSGDETLAIINCKNVLNSEGDWKGMTISFTEKDGFNVHENNYFKSIRGKGIKTATSYIKSPHESDSCTHISLCLD